jgi:hypothetical protein
MFRINTQVLTTVSEEGILAAREDIIQKALDMPYSEVDQLEVSFLRNGIERRLCVHNMVDCDAVFYGHLVQRLSSFGLWPRKTPDQINFAAVQLLGNFSSSTPIPHFGNSNHTPNHRHCHNFQFQVHAEVVLSSVSIPILESHRRHFETIRTYPIQ